MFSGFEEIPENLSQYSWSHGKHLNLGATNPHPRIKSRIANHMVTLDIKMYISPEIHLLT
jgi:hypothetical protein